MSPFQPGRVSFFGIKIAGAGLWTHAGGRTHDAWILIQMLRPLSHNKLMRNNFLYLLIELKIAMRAALDETRMSVKLIMF